MQIFRNWVTVFSLALGWFLLSNGWAAEDNDNTLIPMDYVESFLKDYSPTDTELINDDLDNINRLCFRGISPASAEKERWYVATAGGPGSSKSTILENYLANTPTKFVYLDPDQRALRFMINTYLQELTNYKLQGTPDISKFLQNAYNKWRGASNYIASTLINNAYAEGYNIAHGTTSTSPHVVKLYQKLKLNGYKILIMLCSSSDKNRLASIAYRAKNLFFCQNDPEDTVNKGRMFVERFPNYFHNADELHFYWVDNFLKGSKLAATIKKGEALVIHDKKALNKFIRQYDHDRKGKDLPSWDQLIQDF